MHEKKILKKYQKTLQEFMKGKKRKKPSFVLVTELLKLLRKLEGASLRQRIEKLARDLEQYNNKGKQQEENPIWVHKGNKNPENAGKSCNTPITTITEALNTCSNTNSVWIY